MNPDYDQRATKLPDNQAPIGESHRYLLRMF